MFWNSKKDAKKYLSSFGGAWLTLKGAIVLILNFGPLKKMLSFAQTESLVCAGLTGKASEKWTSYKP